MNSRRTDNRISSANSYAPQRTERAMRKPSARPRQFLNRRGASFLVYVFILALATGCRSTRSLDGILIDLESRNVMQAPESWSINGFDGPKKRVSLSGGHRETFRDDERGWEEIEVLPVQDDNGDAAVRVFVSWVSARTRVQERIWDKCIQFPDDDAVSSFSIGADYLPIRSPDENEFFTLYLVRPDFVVFSWPSPVKTKVFDLEVSSCYRVFQIRRYRANHIEQTMLKEMIVEGEEIRTVREANDSWRFDQSGK